MWSLVGVNLAVAGWIGTLVAWICFCLCALQLFKMYTFGRGYAQGLSFLQRLKSWDLINWGQRLKLINSVLVALFVLQAAPGHGLWALGWGAFAGLLALASFARTRDRALLLAALVLGGLLAPWEKIVAFVSM